MADLAKLGFIADTSDLTVAEQKLRKIGPAAKVAEESARRVTTALTGIGTGSKNATTALVGLGAGLSGTEKLNAFLGKSSAAANTLSKSTLAASTSIGQFGSAVAVADAKLDTFTSGLTQAGIKAQALKGPLDSASKSMRNLGVTAGQMQANTANLMAQFQDVAVTAQMGMSPFMIGMQQGTQAALVMQQAIGKQGLLGGLGLVAKSLLATLGPITLLTIAVTGLLAVGIQSVDWANTAAATLNFLADNMERIIQVTIVLGGVMLVAFGPQILTAIYTMTVAIGVGLYSAIMRAVTAMIAFALANPWSAFVLGIAAAVAAALYFAKKIDEWFGTNIIGTIKNALNFIIGGFVGAFKAIRDQWSKLPAVMGDISVQAANAVITAIEWMINASIEGIRRVLRAANPILALADAVTGGAVTGLIPDASLGRMKNKNAGAAADFATTGSDIVKAEQEKNWAGMASDAVSSFADNVGNYLRNLASGLLSGGDESKKTKTGRSSTARATATERDPWADFLKNTQARVDAMDFELASIGLMGEAAAKAKYGYDLLAQAKAADIKITDDVIAKIDEFATHMARVDTQIALTRDYNQRTDAMREELDMIGAHTRALGMNEVETARLLIEQQLLNDERYRDIKRTKEQKDGIIAYTVAVAEANEALRQANELYALQEDTFKSFFKGMWDDVKQGVSIWKAFANSVIDSLTRIGEKLFDTWLSDAFQGIMGDRRSGGSGGVLGSIIGGIGSLFGGGKAFAKGSAFGSSGILTSPTAFGYGNGQLGVAGEAGEEALMPLARGPDGSLGVQVHGAMQNGPTRVILVVRGEPGPLFVPTVETIADQRAVAVTQDGIAQYDHSLPERVQAISNDPRAR